MGSISKRCDKDERREMDATIKSWRDRFSAMGRDRKRKLYLKRARQISSTIGGVSITAFGALRLRLKPTISPSA